MSDSGAGGFGTGDIGTSGLGTGGVGTGRLGTGGLGAGGLGAQDETPVFVISVAAQLAGMHAQTLRQYDRLGLVSPSRTRGGGRRYSSRDVALLREVQRLSQEGVSLAGIQRILDLENHVAALQSRVAELTADLDRLRSVLGAGPRVFAAGRGGDVVAVRAGQRPSRTVSSSRALVVWSPRR